VKSKRAFVAGELLSQTKGQEDEIKMEDLSSGEEILLEMEVV